MKGILNIEIMNIHEKLLIFITCLMLYIYIAHRMLISTELLWPTSA